MGAGIHDSRWPDIPEITDCPPTLPDPILQAPDFVVQPAGFPARMMPPPVPGDPLYDPLTRTPPLQDFTVIDAHRLPTSKDQCKNGGWQAFGVIKNQGDCVSFVATGGKNPPAGTPRR